MVIGRCETLTDFNAGVDFYFNFLSLNAPLNAKDLYKFLKVNDDYEFNSETTEKLSLVLRTLSSIVDKDNPQHKTLSKIEKLVGAKTNVLGKPETELSKLFGSDDHVQKAIQLLRHDRFTNDVQLAEFLKKLIGEMPPLDEAQIEKDPFRSMLILILRNDATEDHLRGAAADAYIAQNPDDKRFEKAYVYLKTPNVLLAHLLIYSNAWRCANPMNVEFYDEQMAGIFHGTIAFDQGDRLSPEELAMVQGREGQNPQYPILKSLEEKEGYFEVKKWCSTPPMNAGNTRIDDLFITSRREIQEKVLAGFVGQLEITSTVIQKVYGLVSNESCVVAVIGPYGAGKSQYVQQKFPEEKPTVFSLDRLNELLMSPTSRRQDHHFEAMMLTNKLLKHVNEIPALLTEVAAIDQFRFNRLLTRDFSLRNRIIIEEIAPENEMDSVSRFIKRERMVGGGAIDQSRIDAAITSAKDALRFRAERIERAQQQPKVVYTLYCNSSADATLTMIAKVTDGMLSVNEERREIFTHLTPVAAE